MQSSLIKNKGCPITREALQAFVFGPLPGVASTGLLPRVEGHHLKVAPKVADNIEGILRYRFYDLLQGGWVPDLLKKDDVRVGLFGGGQRLQFRVLI